MTDNPTCPEMVYRGTDWDPRREPCGKPVKRDGHCGIHANAADKSKARSEKRAGGHSRAKEARELAAQFDGGAHGDVYGVHLTLETARDILARLKDQA